MTVRQDCDEHRAGPLLLRQRRQFRAGLPDQPEHGVMKGRAAAGLQHKGRNVCGVHRGVDPLIAVIELRQGEPAAARCSRTKAANPPTVSPAMALMDPERSRRT
jgi:hypothetical protein